MTAPCTAWQTVRHSHRAHCSGTLFYERTKSLMKKRPMRQNILIGVLAVSFACVGQAGEYQSPAPHIARVLLERPLPMVSVSPAGDWLMLGHQSGQPDVSTLLRPTLFLDLYRFDVATGKRVAVTGFSEYTAVHAASGRRLRIAGGNGIYGWPLWAPDGKQFAVARATADRLELWIGSVERPQLERVTDRPLGLGKSTFGAALPCSWLPDGKSIACLFFR